MAAKLWFCVYAAFVVWDSYLVQRTLAVDKLHCPSACSCLGNMVDCSKSGLIEVPKDLPSWVTILDLQSNGIYTLKEDDFSGLHNLQELDLSNNDLDFINDSVFQHLTSLKTLKINYNKLTDLPKFSKSSSLSQLSLNHNQIINLTPEALATMPNLRSLDLNYNQLMDLPIGTFPVGSKLQQLFLNNNRILSLEQGCLDNLGSLEWLKLSKNKLFDLQKKLFANLTALKTLELTRNKIQKIEGLTFHGLDNLQVLKLKRNTLSVMSDGAFWGLEKIKNLQLDHNNITSVTKGWTYGLDTLEHLSLAHNNIYSIEAECWTFCQKLNKLDLTQNKITTIADWTFAKLKSLSALYLDHNKISRIDAGAFRDLSSLKTLEMNNNEISWTIEDFSGAFFGLKNLNKLSMKSNRITSVADEAFSGLDKLRQLHLEGNAITSIQENSFDPISELRDLRFNSSSFLCDCKLAWLPTWLQRSGFQHSVYAICNHPPNLHSKSIFDIKLENFTCTDTPRPIIRKNPKSQIALKGDNVTLLCSAEITGNKEPQFQWKKDNTILTGVEIENRATSNGEVKQYTTLLHLRNVQDDTAGRYQCVISTDFGSVYSERAKIMVHVFPVFTKTPVDVTVKAGKSAKLECSAKGQPAPVVAWQKDGGDDFPAARERRMHVMPSDDTFFIVQTKSIDEGVYSCTATNDAGTIVINATVTVLETPSFIRPMEKEKITHVGRTSVLECMASGSPKPKLTWMKDGQILEITNRHFLTANDQLLIIVETKGTDEGSYTCKMSNTLGTQTGKTKLIVSPPGGHPGEAKEGTFGLDDESTTTGIIIIAVVCCVVGTSLVWVIIIYQTRKRHDLYSSTPTDETTLPCEVPSSGYTSSDKEGSFTQAPITVQGYQYQDYQMKESGYESSSGRFRPNGLNRPAAIFPSDVDEDDHQQSVPLTLDEHQPGRNSGGNSISSLHYPHSETDTIGSSHSTSSTHTSGHHTLRTFHPQPTNHDRCPHGENCDNCENENCESCEHSRTVGTSPQFLTMHKNPSISSIPSSRSSSSLGRPEGVSCGNHNHRKCSSPGKHLLNHTEIQDSAVCECINEVNPSRCTAQHPPINITCNHLERLQDSLDWKNKVENSHHHKLPNGAPPEYSVISQYAPVNTHDSYPYACSANHVLVNQRDCANGMHKVIPMPLHYMNSPNKRKKETIDV